MSHGYGGGGGGDFYHFFIICYQLLSALFHNGLHPQSGSYSCKIRDGTSA